LPTWAQTFSVSTRPALRPNVRWVRTPAPRFSRTPSKAGEIPATLGAHTEAALAGAGFVPAEITDLRANGIVR